MSSKKKWSQRHFAMWRSVKRRKTTWERQRFKSYDSAVVARTKSQRHMRCCISSLKARGRQPALKASASTFHSSVQSRVQPYRNGVLQSQSIFPKKLLGYIDYVGFVRDCVHCIRFSGQFEKFLHPHKPHRFKKRGCNKHLKTTKHVYLSSIESCVDGALNGGYWCTEA